MLKTTAKLATAAACLAVLSGCFFDNPMGEGTVFVPFPVVVGMVVGEAAKDIGHSLNPKVQAQKRAGDRYVDARDAASRAGLALMEYGAAHDQFPGHPAVLVAERSVALADWRLLDSSRRVNEIPVGPTTLGKLTGSSRKDQAIREAELALPDHVVAVRLGDLVFTYFGAPFTDGMDGLWTVVLLPDDELKGREFFWYASAGSWNVTERGQVRDGLHLNWIRAREWPGRLAEQNALRATLGLPALPDLSSMTPGGGVSVADTLPPEPGEWQLLRRDRGHWGDTSQKKADAIARALARYARDHDGTLPAHAAALVAEAYLDPSTFIDAGSATDPADIPLGRTTLGALPALSPAQRRHAVEMAAAALPKNVVAYRVGDVVFTYPGLDINREGSRELWTAVLCSDATSNPPRRWDDKIQICKRPGEPMEMTYDIIKYRLDEQNGHRAAVGLAPIPDPASLTRGEFATSP